MGQQSDSPVAGQTQWSTDVDMLSQGNPIIISFRNLILTLLYMDGLFGKATCKKYVPSCRLIDQPIDVVSWSWGDDSGVATINDSSLNNLLSFIGAPKKV